MAVIGSSPSCGAPSPRSTRPWMRQPPHTRRVRRRGVLAVCGALLAAAPYVAQGQYFGRNKVLWERLDFEVLETPHFLIHHYPPDSPTGAYTAALAERWYERLSLFFDHELEEKIPIIVYRDHAGDDCAPRAARRPSRQRRRGSAPRAARYRPELSAARL